MAPAISRSRTAGSKTQARARCGRGEGRPFQGDEDIGGGAGARRFREHDAALGA